MSQILDLNKMAASIYNTVLKMQESATQMVGIDALWCRAIPHQESADVVIQEYTLSNVECPRAIKVISDKTDYQAGTYNVDLWGVSFEAPFEISVNITTWESVYGKGSAPQKGDIVYIQILNRLYEVSSSTIVYTLTTLPSSYKCTLRKYQRSAARRENEEIRISIDELTNAQDELFGEAISNEVADAIIERETSYSQSTIVDPIRVCDLSAIVTEDVLGAHGNLISHAYHHFIAADSNLYIRGTEARYGTNMDPVNTHWIYSAWYRFAYDSVSNEPDDETGNVTTGTIGIEINVNLKGLYTKDRNYYYFFIEPVGPVNIGENVELFRGSHISISGTISQADCDNKLLILVPTSEVLETNKKAMKWWDNLKTGWKIRRIIKTDKETGVQKSAEYNLLSAYAEDEVTKMIDVFYTGVKLKIKFGNSSKTIKAPEFIPGDWHYMMLDFCNGKARMVVNRVYKLKSTDRYTDKIICDKEYSIGNPGDFTVSGFGFENAGDDIDICNIRMYESEYAMGDNWKTDMYSQLTRNASKLIFIDNPQPANIQPFVSPMR